MYEAGGSLESLDLKIWRNFEISCFFLCYNICVGGECEGFCVIFIYVLGCCVRGRRDIYD